MRHGGPRQVLRGSRDVFVAVRLVLGCELVGDTEDALRDERHGGDGTEGDLDTGKIVQFP